MKIDVITIMNFAVIYIIAVYIIPVIVIIKERQ